MKRIKINSVVPLLIIISVLIGNDKKHEDITNEQKLYGLVTIWSEVKFGFPYPEKLESLNWDARLQEFIPKVLNAQDLDEYYYTLMEFATLLQDSHTSVLPPWGHFKLGYDMPPIEIAILNNKFYIASIGENSEVQKYGLTVGIELIEINDIPINKYFKEHILKYYSQGSKHANEAILVAYLLNGPGDEKIKLKVKSIEGVEKTIELTRSSLNDDGSPFLYPFIRNMFVENSLTIKELDNDIIYVKIPNFDNMNFGDEFHALIDNMDSSKVKGMIIDVRNNMGGDSRVCNKIVECLIDEPVISPLMTYPLYSAAYKAWGRKESWKTDKNTITPREGKKYLGPIAVITNSITNSTAEDLAIELKYGNRAKIVGQKTAGGAGNMLQIELPYAGKFQLATFKALLPDGKEYVGLGIEPDVPVELTVDDILNNTDKLLKTSIEVLMEK